MGLASQAVDDVVPSFRGLLRFGGTRYLELDRLPELEIRPKVQLHSALLETAVQGVGLIINGRGAPFGRPAFFRGNATQTCGGAA